MTVCHAGAAAAAAAVVMQRSTASRRRAVVLQSRRIPPRAPGPGRTVPAQYQPSHNNFKSGAADRRRPRRCIATTGMCVQTCALPPRSPMESSRASTAGRPCATTGEKRLQQATKRAALERLRWRAQLRSVGPICTIPRPSEATSSATCSPAATMRPDAPFAG
jgi:hypothetical protein